MFVRFFNECYIILYVYDNNVIVNMEVYVCIFVFYGKSKGFLLKIYNSYVFVFDIL